LRSISRPPSRSASMFLCSSSNAPTRSSSSRSLPMHFAAPAQVCSWHGPEVPVASRYVRT
jgi:hypothetical protein